MPQKNTKEVFTLLLISSRDGTVDPNNSASVSYMVNFDSLFQGREKLYKRCIVRSNWTTGGITATTVNNTVGVLEIQGLFSGNLLGDSSHPLLFIYPFNSASAGTGGFYFQTTSNFNTVPLMGLNTAVGVETTIPSGIRRFLINELSVVGNSLSTYTTDYSVIIQFELYNE